MALNAPNCKDTQDVQFKLHDKFVAFRKCGDLRSNVKLLAVSSSRDLLFAGNPAAPELKVIIIKDVVAAKSTGKQPMARRVVLPHIPNYMSCSADGNMLAINYTQSNGTSLLLIYAVQSFMTPDIRAMYNIRLAPEDFVHAVQLLWNPVLPNSLAVVLSNGGLGMYTLKEAGNFELHSLDKSQRVKCGCWSPKGKQLVLGFPDGRLQQFKPDLTPAKTLVCPPNVHEGPFDTIAVHWLSTFQFAVIFLQHGEDCSPALYIINAPKTGTPTYINYFDICYSLNGPRNHQFHFTHVQQWNLLLVSSANGVEVGVLGTAETGDTPSWEQLTLLDEARIELPLSEATQDETFPLGFVFDTSSTHQLTINEKQLPSMPMVHVLGTDGTLLTFNFLNLQPGAASVCSPPPPLMDTSGQFYALNTLLGNDEQSIAAAPVAVVAKPTAAVVESSAPAQSDISFAFTPNTVTSTPAPAKEKPAPMFAGFGNASKITAPPPTFGAPSAPLNFASATPSAATAKPLQTTGFGGFGAATTALPAAAPVFGMPVAGTVPNFGNLAAPTASIAAVPPSQPTAGVATAAIATPGKPNNSKPLYTVPPTFTPVAVAPTAGTAVMKPSGKLADISTREVDDVIADIMGVQISAFNEQIEQQKQQTKALLSQIESPASIKFYAKRLDDLQELNDQANDVDFELDVQGLRHALSEAYAIMAECRAKLEGYRNPDITRLMSSTSFDAAGRRILSRLQSYLAANQAQLRLAQQHIDTQWEQYQDVLRRNSKSKMHMPCLEGIYQRLTRLQNMTSDQRIKQTNIKAKLKERGLLQTSLINQENNRNRNNEAVDTLADSILSMSLNQVVETNRAKLSQEKLQSIRHLLQHHKIQIISPQRPDRVGIKSEVILETKLKAEQNKKAAAAIAKPSTAHKSTQAAAQAAAVTSVQLTKPTASKTIVASAPAISAPAPTPISSAPATALPATAAAPPSSFSFFSGSSPFSKATVAPVVAPATNSNSADVTKPPATLPTSSAFSFSFGQMSASPAQPALSFGGLSMTTKPPAPAAASVGAAPNLFAGFGATPLDGSKPKPAVEQPKDIQAKPLELKKDVPAPVEFKPTVVEPVKSVAEPSTGTFGTTFSTPTVKPTTPKVDPAPKPFSFAGFGSNAGTTIGGNASSTFSFGGFGSSLGNSAAPKAASVTTAEATSVSAAVAIPTTAASGIVSPTNISKSKPIVPAATAAPPALGEQGSGTVVAPAVSTSNADPTENAFRSINICKPQVKEKAADAPPANIFSGFAANTAGGFQSSEASKGIFGGAADGGSKTAATIASPAVTTAALPIATTAPAIATSTTTSSLAVPTTTTAIVSTVAATVQSTFGASVAPAVTTSAVSSAAPGISFSFSNAFSNLGSPSAPAAATPTTGASTTSNASSSIFGGGNAFAPTTGASASPFQAAPTSTAAAPPPTNLFGSVPKPEASVFGGASTAAAPPPSGLFAAAAASTSPSTFGGSPAAAPAASAASSGGNIFGQAAAAVKPGGFGSPAPAATSVGGSIFGGASSTAASPFGGTSIFGSGSTAQSPPPAAAPTGGSIFGQSVFGSAAPASGGNLFSTSSAAPATGFGGGSVFGGTPANATSPNANSGSIFGGGNSSGGFGSFAQTTPAAGGFGSGFAQTTGGSVAQSGFGSPQPQNPQSPAGGFGAKPVFGGSPAFGASPTFGGAPTFGSPKGFGTFGNSPNVIAPPAFGGQPKPAEGNIFETLGGTDTSLSFGNLAQTGNTNTQKSTFGGSSFMTYR
ncbi:nuclear pore complex protein Nup214 [Drosophila albomicans]|uniref:Nuclear pore complex protein Nup214 n=1 Tax=Drosophila albomicans TaxID=7291 RepID=A0A6P8X5J0_DROAB|nr:nuclear pore complex protein Nup214 [Drosophila albomicans]XP_034111501.1 nuclear pore complex protein Nup214 [Drosophila albomicans]XP_051861855.1 nuclear pore complex protein Nup214 [Drosophila albomicans]